MDKISLFGGFGFVGDWYYKIYPHETIRNLKYDYVPETNNILSFISTVDNYNLQRELPYVDVRSNILTLLVMLENARSGFDSNFTLNFISSWFVYGKIDKCPANEDAICNPTGFYSITKRCAEQLLISYCETYGIKYRILRLANVLGVGDSKISAKKNATQFMIKELVQGRSIHLYKGVFLRDFIDVRDAVSAIRLVLKYGNTNEIYNIGNGIGTAINDIVGYTANKVHSSKVELVDVPEFHKLVQVQDMYLDTKKLRDLGYNRKYTMTDTLDWLIESYK
jgi:nucleoside-diphosphate-sugar epimerase